VEHITQEDIREALALWADFPVHREPRPIVVTELPSRKLDELKDDTAWRAKFDGVADPGLEMPAELRPALELSYGITMTEAEGRRERIVRGNAPFNTDRGIRELPAWSMHPRNARWPFIGLDPEFRREMTWWPKGLECYGGDQESSLAADGRTLTYRFSGTPASYASYPHAEVIETETAVFVEPVPVDLDGDGIRLMYMETREVVVRLAAPLGNRVLIWAAHGPGESTFGNPRTVITSPQA
jgi:hypothetical protein